MAWTRGFKLHTKCILIIGSMMVLTQAMDGPSPDTEFTVQPSNVTVPEGQHAIMKCKTTSKSEVCRWYYLENGLSFYDSRFTPTLVKDFAPAHHHDCSIRFTKVRKVQEGQWLCQALKIHSTRFIMSRPATLKVLRQEPREGRIDDFDIEDEDVVKFDTNEEEHIQNAPVGETSSLKCKVNRPITDCSWIMPQGAVFHLTKADPDRGHKTYALVGDLKEGNCSLVISEVRLQDEGNWRCVVKVEGQDAVKGPLLHLHILDPANPIHHDPGLSLKIPEVDSANLLIIILVATSLVLFIVVIFLFTCLYRRLKENSIETRKILENSPRTSADLSTRIIPTTDLKSDMKIDFQPGSRSPLCYSDIDHYQYQYHDYSEIDSPYTKYLDMSGMVGTPTDGYIRIADNAARASTRTILSNVSTLPMRRDRSVSNSTTSTTLSAMTPGGSSHNFDNPSYNVESNNTNGFCESDAVYPEHLYEEIKERPQPKEDEGKTGKMDIIEEVKTPETSPEIITTPETPTYANAVEDYNGYMIPKHKNNTSNAKEKKEINTPPQKVALPTPKGSQESINSLHNESADVPNSTPITVVAPPYSCIGDTGLIPLHPALQAVNNEGYSRVGTVIPNSTDIYNIPNNIPINPMENYDTPRNIESYDVPRNIPVDPFERYDTPTNIPVEDKESNDTSNISPANSETTLNNPAVMEVRVDGLLGTVV